MTNITKSLIFAFLFLFSSFSFITPINSQNQITGTVTLNIHITDIQNTKGKKIFVGIFDKKGFPKDHKAIYSAEKAADNNNITLSINLPLGTYAAAVYHDINENGRMDKNMFGIPKEPYGLSNNVVPKFKEPTFEECSFTVRGNGKNISINLIH
jgi:uncharacterized protein (DUF2141 family)